MDKAGLKLIKQLTPQNVGCNIKRRMGTFLDGGYVVAEEMLKHSDVLYTFGVGQDVSFEYDYLKYAGKSCHMYDHTVDYTVPHMLRDKLQFHKKALGPSKAKYGNTISGHIKENVEDINAKFLVKIDIEGYEIDYFTNDLEDLLIKSATGLIMEFHLNDKNIKNFVTTIDNISKHFTPVWIHANNYIYTSDIPNIVCEGVELPRAIEMSFVNTKYFNVKGFNPSRDVYPIVGLDYPCNPNIRDIHNNWLTETGVGND